MKIKIQDNSISMEDLNSTLSAHFSGKYEVTLLNKTMLAVAQSKTIGAVVIPSKKWVAVNGNFPTMKGQMLFMIIVIALGILIPLIVYFSVYHKKMKAVENEVSEFLKMHYQSKLV